MRNRWNAQEDKVIGWSAPVGEDVLYDVLRHAEECDVLRVLQAPAVGYDRGVDQRPYPDFLRDVPLTDPATALVAIRRASARIAYADPEGSVVEDDVVDLAALPPGAGQARRVRTGSPLEVRAVRLYGEVELRVGSRSDIWLPWCSARFEEGAHRDDLADNRHLADRHTPRLNEFLTRIAEQCAVRLAVEPDDTAPDLAFQLHDHGVRLDTVDPAERTVWERFGGRGQPDLADALLAAAATANRSRPVAPYRAAIGVWSTASDHPLFRAPRDTVRDAVRSTGIGAVLDGATRVKVQAGEVQFVFAPDEVD